MTDITIFHNPRCSKSRSACELIAARGIKASIVNYLATPPSIEELRALLGKLGMKAHDLVRRGEPEYKELYAGKQLDDDAWLAALAAHPVLIERPIIVRGDKAVIGRPPEKALELLDAAD